jgi:hypothetical protein
MESENTDIGLPVPASPSLDTLLGGYFRSVRALESLPAVIAAKRAHAASIRSHPSARGLPASACGVQRIGEESAYRGAGLHGDPVGRLAAQWAESAETRAARIDAEADALEESLRGHGVAVLAVGAALRQLPPKAQAIIRARYTPEGNRWHTGWEHVADAVEMSVSQVKDTWARLQRDVPGLLAACGADAVPSVASIPKKQHRATYHPRMGRALSESLAFA